MFSVDLTNITCLCLRDNQRDECVMLVDVFCSVIYVTDFFQLQLIKLLQLQLEL